VDDWQGDPQWFYMQLTKSQAEASKFKMHVAIQSNGWNWWEISDGNWLSLTFNGFAYRSGLDNKVAWKIVGGKLYNDYAIAKDFPLAAAYYSFLVSPAYYVGVNYGDQYVLTGCELVPVP
ncbi:MAG: hypothetical protein ABIQ31_05580, partial [Ferruginibacter sp.]